MDKMLQWTLRLGQNVTVDVVNLDVTSRQQFYFSLTAGYGEGASKDPCSDLYQVSSCGQLDEILAQPPIVFLKGI